MTEYGSALVHKTMTRKTVKPSEKNILHKKGSFITSTHQVKLNETFGKYFPKDGEFSK